MKKKILTGLVLLSSLAFFNCGDTATAISDAQSQLSAAQQQAAQENVEPNTGLPVDPTYGVPVDPASGLPINPATLEIYDPATGTVLGVYVPQQAAPVAGDDLLTSSADNQIDVGAQPGAGALTDAGTQPDAGANLSSASGNLDAGEGTLANSSSSVDLVSSASFETSSSATAGDFSAASSANETVDVPESSAETTPVQQAPQGIYLSAQTDENKDGDPIVYLTNTGWDGQGILAYPRELSETQKHGIVVWGPGGGTAPSAYEGIIRRLASHGFVVIALKESPGNATQAIPAIDWLQQKNSTDTSVFYQKLDMNTVGCSGHSMGGLESEQALIKDSRVITALLNNSGAMTHDQAAVVSAEKSIAILYGEGGMERPNAEADYNNPGVKAPACLIKMEGGVCNPGTQCECQNGECGWGHGSGSWGGMGATVAWMRWHLGGENNRQSDFVGSFGKYINGEISGAQGHWKTQCKNF